MRNIYLITDFMDPYTQKKSRSHTILLYFKKKNNITIVGRLKKD